MRFAGTEPCNPRWKETQESTTKTFNSSIDADMV